MGKHNNQLREENERLKRQLEYYETRNANAWKPHQLVILKDMAGKEKPEDIAKATGRTLSSVRNKAQSLGLSLSQKPRKAWTTGEIEKARNLMYAGFSLKDISEKLGRTESAVKDKLYR